MMSPPLETSVDSQMNSPGLTHQTAPLSRPGSGSSGPQGISGQYYDQTRSSQQQQPPTSTTAPQQQQQQQQQQQNKSSVVIKVGMVGDAQIGKTSLMVKYVEGSWDEDYIQTLGESHAQKRSAQPY